MPAITTLLAVASVGSGLKANSDAKKAARRQEEQQAKQATALKEESLFEAQAPTQAGADILVGTNKVSDKLLKLDSTKKIGKGAKVGGLTSNATNIGGL